MYTELYLCLIFDLQVLRSGVQAGLRFQSTSAQAGVKLGAATSKPGHGFSFGMLFLFSLCNLEPLLTVY